MKVTYIGEEAETTAFGITFPKGKAVTVDDGLTALVTNPQFEVKGATAPDPEPAPLQA